jgi:hypothetical protein
MTKSNNETPYARIPQPLGLFAGDLHSRAREYLEAAKLVGGGVPEKLVSPTYYLLGLSIELSFKAFLAAEGESKRRLRRIGHDLPGLMQAATAKGLPPLEHLDVLVRHLMTINTDHNLRYPAGQILSILRFEQASQITADLYQVINDNVMLAYLRARISYLQDYQGKYVQWSD